MNIDDILKDEKNYPDTLELPVGDQKIPLSTLRSAYRAVSAEREQLGKDRQTVADLASKAAQLNEKLEQQMAAASQTESGRRTAPTDDEFDADPFFAPVRKRLDPIQKTVEELKKTNEQLAKSVANAATIWARDRWEGQLSRNRDRLKGDKYKQYQDVESILKYATDNRILDTYGFPSVEGAINKLTEGDTIEQIKTVEYERGLKEGQMKARIASMSRPTSASGPKGPEKSVVAERGLEGLGDDVANDPELMDMLSQLGAVTPEDIVQ
jgi:hypothetical protein